LNNDDDDDDAEIECSSFCSESNNDEQIRYSLNANKVSVEVDDDDDDDEDEATLKQKMTHKMAYLGLQNVLLGESCGNYLILTESETATSQSIIINISNSCLFNIGLLNRDSYMTNLRVIAEIDDSSLSETFIEVLKKDSYLKRGLRYEKVNLGIYWYITECCVLLTFLFYCFPVEDK
jgi:hypothetical protein